MPPIRYTIPPKAIIPEILRLCASIGTGVPTYVPVFTNPAAIENECFENVKSMVAINGGELIHGWTIWEWPKVMVEAEFHACWKSPIGELMDITHKTFDRILFLPDHTRRFVGIPFDNKRQALTNDPIIHRFISVTQQLGAMEFAGFDPIRKEFRASSEYGEWAAEFAALRSQIIKKYRANKLV